MFEFISNPSRFIGISYTPTPMWAQRLNYKIKPLVQLSLFFIKVNINMPFKHNAKKQFGSASERYSFVFRLNGYYSFQWGL